MFELIRGQAGRHPDSAVGDPRAAADPQIATARSRTRSSSGTIRMAPGLRSYSRAAAGPEGSSSTAKTASASRSTAATSGRARLPARPMASRLTVTGGRDRPRFVRIGGLSRFVTIRNVEIDGAWPRLAKNGSGIRVNDHRCQSQRVSGTVARRDPDRGQLHP